MGYLIAPINTEKRKIDPVKEARAKEALVGRQEAVPANVAAKVAAAGAKPVTVAQPKPVQTVPAVMEKTTAQKRDEAKALYESYIQSDEYKQNLNTAAKAQTDAWMMAAITGNAEPMRPAGDQKEQELKALVDHYTALAQKEANEATLTQALQELEGWSEEDRKALEAYWVQDAWERQHPMGDPITGGSRQVSGEIAAPLFAKYGETTVRKLAEALEWKQSAGLTEQATASGQSQAGETFFDNMGADIASIGAKGVGNLTALMGYITELGRRTGQFSTLNPNNIGNLPNAYGGAVQGQKAENLAADGGKLDAYLYQGGMSVADNALRMAMGGGATGGAVLAATGSFAQAVSEASARGATPGEAVALATVTAGIEAASEKIPLDNLMDAAKTGGHGVKEILKNALMQAGIEATTEEISLIGTTLAEAAILREKAGYRQRVNELIAEGMTPEAATRQADNELLKEAADTAIVSAMSGGMSEAGASIAGNLTHRSRDLNAGGQQKNSDAYNPEATGEQVPELTEQEKTDRAMEETAAQWGQEAPKAEPVQKTEAELGIDRAYEATVGTERDQEAALTAQTNAISNPLDSYPTEKQNSIRSYIRSVDESVKGFVQQVKSGDKTFRRQKIADVNDRAAKDIGDILGIDAGGYTHNINTNGVRHILNRHGENGEHDSSMAVDDDIARIGWVLENYDSAEAVTDNGEQVYSTEFRDSNDNPAPQIRFIKKIDGTYYVVEAACENKYKKLWVQSAYLQKNNGDVTQASAADPSANHKKDARSALASPSPNNSVPQNDQEVNGNIDESRAQGVDGQEQSMEGGQAGIKGTGAAEANFSGKAAYQDMLTDDNVQPDRPGDVRPMEVPKQDADGRNVSEFAANAYGAAVTPDRMANEIEQLIQDGALGFDRVSNEEALNNARDAIYGKDGQKGRGESRTMTDIRKNIYNGKIQDGDIEKALLLYAKYANRKSESSLDNAAELTVDLTYMAHMTGRNLQLFKLLRRMTPEGQLLAVQRSVERHAEDMISKGQVKKGYEPSIDQELMDDYLEAAKELKEADTPGKQKDAEQKVKEAEEAIYAAEAAKMPATFKAKWDAWRYMCMLGNAKTQVRNVVGNLAFRPYKDVKDAIGAGLERAFIRDKSKRTKAVLNAASEGDRQLLAWAKADRKSDTVHDALKYSAKLGDDVSASKMDENRKVFDTKALEAFRNFVEKVPAGADLLFKNGHYERSLAGFLKARGYTAADLQQGLVKDEVLNEARSYAIQEAMKATFNDCNAFSDFMSSIGRNPVHRNNPVAKAMNVVGEAVLPFRRTPANIVVRFEEYSPLGLINTAVKTAKHIRSGDISAAAAIDSLASSVTGTGALALGFFLAKGIGGFRITGSLDDEDEKRQGHQEYAVEFSLDGQEYSYRIDWAAPANLPLFVGANLYNLLASASNEDASVSKFTSFLYSTATMFEPMLSLSCLSSLNDLFETGKYSDGNALYSVAAQAATSYLTQGIPSLAKQGVQAFQENRQTTFANSEDPLLRDLQRTAAATGIVPGLKTDAIDEWGRVDNQGIGIVRALNAFLNPGTLKQIDNGALEQEITRLNDSQPDSVSPPDTPKTISYTDSDGNRHTAKRLTEQEYATLAEVQGQTAKKLLDQILEDKRYGAMTDEQKASVFQYVYDYAREKGRNAALPGYQGLDGWMKDIQGNAADAILDKAVKNAFTDAFEQLEHDPEGAAAALDQAYGLVDPKNITEWAKNAGGRTKYFVDAKRRGVDAATFLSLYQQFRDIDSNPVWNASDKAEKWSYQLEKAQEDGTITKAQKDALKKSMVYYQMFPAETAKFDQMTEAGIDADDALDIGKLLEGIKPQSGYSDVRDVQKAAALAGSSLSPSEKAAAMKIYLPPAQDENLDLMLGLGYSPEDYAAVYEIYANAKGTGAKRRVISRIQAELGVDYGTAREIYEIYG